jgi:hypothetical protein
MQAHENETHPVVRRKRHRSDLRFCAPQMWGVEEVLGLGKLYPIPPVIVVLIIITR